MKPRILDHRHEVFRVVRAGWTDPLSATFSRSAPDRRWNTSDFGALYLCCSEGVARAIVNDLFKITGVELDELQPAYLPQLVEIAWEGQVVDVASEAGVRAAGFLARYPKDIKKAATRAASIRFRKQGFDGVVCRSASLERMGMALWTGDHATWSEVAVFEEAAERARVVSRRRDLDWLRSGFRPDRGERHYLLEVCRFTRWNLRRTARILGISPKSLYVKLKQYGISRPM